MKVKVSLFSLSDKLHFKHLKRDRLKKISLSPSTPLKASYKSEEIANIYHPYKQHLIITKIEELSSDIKLFTLSLDKKYPCKDIAPFKAGSHINLIKEIDNGIISRAYTLFSSPIEALKENNYRILVKRKEGGIFSSYLIDKCQVGDTFIASEPAGFLTYNRLRDENDVIALASSTAISGFISMGYAIADKIEDFNLTIICGLRTEKDNIYTPYVEDIEKRSQGKVKFVFVISDEESENYEQGFITKEIIQKYARTPYSIFISGSQDFISYITKEISPLNIIKKDIRIERSIDKYMGPDINKEVNIKVHDRDEIINIKGTSKETLMTALERNKILIRSNCHVGGCGCCRVRLITGEVYKTIFHGVREADQKYNYLHACAIYPLSDLEVEIYHY